MVAMRPLGRDGDCEQDIGRAAVFLAGPQSDYVTGENLQVAGGVLIIVP
jgi:NAD(P)-dependent dehydrogenase (short-subunit alcohol dehydrogenase family)